MNKKYLFNLLTFLLIIITAVTIFPLTSFAKNDDIILNADSLIYDGIKNQITAEGNVTAETKDIKIVSKKAIYFTKQKKVKLLQDIKLIKDNAIITCDHLDADFNKKIIIATGDLNFKLDDIEASSDKAVYDLKQEKLSLIGNAKAWQGVDRLTGDTIIILIKKKKIITSGRTKIILSPDKLPERLD